jgi:hypothetical protein
MNVKDKKRLITLAIIAAALGILLLFLRSNEDNWVCKDGDWVKHGNPTSTMPNTPCK